jgi:hypothetical protein
MTWNNRGERIALPTVAKRVFVNLSLALLLVAGLAAFVVVVIAVVRYFQHTESNTETVVWRKVEQDTRRKVKAVNLTETERKLADRKYKGKLVFEDGETWDIKVSAGDGMVTWEMQRSPLDAAKYFVQREMLPIANGQLVDVELTKVADDRFTGTATAGTQKWSVSVNGTGEGMTCTTHPLP